MTGTTSKNPPHLTPPPQTAGPRPFWSVIVTVHNRTLFLPGCLAAVLDQAPPDMEILLADDASEVDLRPLTEEHARGRVRYFRNPRQRGLYGSVNDALARTRGQWIHILHDDDFILPGFYATLQKALAAAPPTVGMASTSYTVLREQENTTWVSPPLRAGAGLLKGFVETLVMGNPLNVPAVVQQRGVFETLGVFREDLPYAADWEMFIRAAARFGWWHVPENLARFRLHRGNQTWLLNAQGRTGEDIRRVLDLAEAHVSPEVRQGALTRSREHHGRLFLDQARTLFARGNVPLGFKYVRESLMLGGEAAHSLEMFQELLRPEAAGLRQELAAAWRAALAAK